MAVLKLVYYPAPCLKKKCEPVAEVDEKIKQLVNDMIETMYAERGVGLAANQIGINLRIFVMDVSDKQNQPIVAINPEILSTEGKQDEAEGCLSFPGVYDKVPKAYQLKFKALDIHGKPYEMDAEDLMASCVQHEVDHLNGLLFIDRLSRIKQERARSKYIKVHRK